MQNRRCMMSDAEREATIEYWHRVNCRSHVALTLGRSQQRVNRRMQLYWNGELHNNLLRQAVQLDIRIRRVTFTHDCGKERFMREAAP